MLARDARDARAVDSDDDAPRLRFA